LSWIDKDIMAVVHGCAVCRPKEYTNVSDVMIIEVMLNTGELYTVQANLQEMSGKVVSKVMWNDPVSKLLLKRCSSMAYFPSSNLSIMLDTNQNLHFYYQMVRINQSIMLSHRN
jgi:hypothetical protein